MTNDECQRRRRLTWTALAYAVVVAAVGGPVHTRQAKAAPFTFDAVFTEGPFGIWFYNSSNAWTHSPNWEQGAVPPNNGTATVSIRRAWRDPLRAAEPGVFVDAPWSIKGLGFGSVYRGDTAPRTINGAMLTVGDDGITNRRSDTATIYNGLTLSATQNFSALIGDLDIRGNVNLQNNILSLREYSGNHINITGVISGAGALNIGGNISSGTDISFSQVHTYTGDTTIDFGSVLRLIGGGKLASATDVVNNGAFVLNSGSRTFNSLSGSGTMSMAGGSVSLAALNGTGQVSLDSGVLNAGSGNFSGLIGGAGGLTKTGVGTLTLQTPQSYTGQTTVSGGTLRLTGAGSIARSSRVLVDAGGTLTIARDGISTVKELSIGAAGIVQFTTGGINNVVTGALTIAGGGTPTGKLDLTNNATIINYTGISPVATVRAQILAGRGGVGLGKTWSGQGITSSTAEAVNVSDPESGSVGYAENSTMPLGPLTTFRGQPVDGTAILIGFTRTGDANLDGVVNDDDVTIVGAMYAPGVPQPSWALGDFDYNGFVDDDDVTLLGAFYDASALPQFGASAEPGTIAPGGVAAVPEPSTAVLVLSILAVTAIARILVFILADTAVARQSADPS
jgi:autotransporter-associated beta strand protein